MSVVVSEPNFSVSLAPDETLTALTLFPAFCWASSNRVTSSAILGSSISLWCSFSLSFVLMSLSREFKNGSCLIYRKLAFASSSFAFASVGYARAAVRAIP